MRAENELNDATVAVDERNPFATPERVAESADGWEFADAPPTVGPSFFGAFWYCLRRSFDFKSRANRTEYFGRRAFCAGGRRRTGNVTSVRLGASDEGNTVCFFRRRFAVSFGGGDNGRGG